MNGSCACGSVTFRADPPLRPVILCHCETCRKQSGHVWAATSVPLDRFHLIRDEGLAWFSATPKARRGFCNRCGSSLFWQPEGGDTISIAAGSLDGATGVKADCHWFVDEAGDYYDLADGLPQHRGEG
jgi:hypothetical protein